jgi:hypothetical protein
LPLSTLRTIRREIPRLLAGTKYLVGVGGVAGGKPKIGKERPAIIDFLPSEDTIAGKASWADGFTSVCGLGKIPKAQPAYPMEE